MNSTHISLEDPRYRDAAAQVLFRHDAFQPEANITSAVRDFLVLTGLAKNEEIVEEHPPSDSSRRAVDLTALDTFVEFKRRIGTVPGGDPDPENVLQLDEYLTESASQGRVRMGVLTDGKRWVLRWPGAGPVQMARPYAFTLDDPNGWFHLYEWLRDTALVSIEGILPDRDSIAEHFGPDSPAYQRDISTLRALYRENAAIETIRVKRRLWYDLLRTALGEVAFTTEGMDAPVLENTEEMDDLFVRHTYLSTVIGMVVQASFGIDIRRLAANDPADLLQGRELYRATGLQGVLESDFFAWPSEVGGIPLLQTLARRLARFNWVAASPDTAANLYETVIPADERRQLGEYYTPAWLARIMVQELVYDPLNQHVLDPACGSGTFLAEAVAHFITAAADAHWAPQEILPRLRDAVTGIDVHPVAAHLARAAWTLAARPAISSAVEAGFDASMSIPVYLGDALQLRFRTGDMFSERTITIQTGVENEPELLFPVSLVERADDFDALMGDLSAYIEEDADPLLALDEHHISDPGERAAMEKVIATLQRLHDHGRDHIWAYYTRNMVRPVVLSRARVDVLIGNPPWINYNQTFDILRTGLENLSRHRYGIWVGGHYATQQDVAGLFFARSVDLYLRDDGAIGFVLPHSALQAGQHAKWRTGRWRATNSGQDIQVDFTHKQAWDLEQLEPNNFFPVPASVVFARKCPLGATGQALGNLVERWRGKVGSEDVRRETESITGTGRRGESPYGALSRNGATIFPRVLFFVNETVNSATVQAAPTVTVNPRRGSQDKAPWKDMDLIAITGQTLEKRHVFNVHLGETVAPYVALEPLRALLPLKQGDTTIPAEVGGPGGIRLGGLERRMRGRWQTISALWEENKAPANQLNLLEQLNYLHKLSSQLEWQSNPAGRPVRLVYTSSGQPTAAILYNDSDLVENLLFWVACTDTAEANYLLAIINSQALYDAVSGMMPKGQFGARHLHKHLWKLPIPGYDSAQELHTAIAAAGVAAAAGAEALLTELREERGNKLTITIVRREVRKWLRASDEGKAVEIAVAKLLKGE